MLDKIFLFFKRSNEYLNNLLSGIFSSYLPQNNTPFFASYVLLLMKVIIIIIIILIPVCILKIWKHESSFLTIVILTMIFVIALAIFGIFLGFFQLLYS